MQDLVRIHANRLPCDKIGCKQILTRYAGYHERMEFHLSIEKTFSFQAILTAKNQATEASESRFVFRIVAYGSRKSQLVPHLATTNSLLPDRYGILNSTYSIWPHALRNIGSFLPFRRFSCCCVSCYIT